MNNFKKLMFVGAAAVAMTASAGVMADDGSDINHIKEPTPYSYQSDYPADERTAGSANANYEVKGTIDADRDGYVGDVDVDLQAKANSNINSQLSANEIAEAQEALNENGFRVSVDGIVGPETRGAVESFQSTKDMPATGNFTPQTLAALDVLTMEEMQQRWDNKM